MAEDKKIESPCVSLCAVSGKTGYCLGCGRSLREIAGWREFSDTERADISAQLPARLAATKRALK